MLSRIALGCLFLLVSNTMLAQISADVRFNYKRGSYKGSYYDVIVTKNGKEQNLTWFQPWEEVLMAEVSPDSNYVFVRHRPQGRRAYRLSLYNLKTLKLVRTIIPGTGGTFEWTSLNQVMHTWGCGTNCAPMRIYDLRLNAIFHTLSSGGYIMSPAKRYVVQFSMHADKMWVYDLRSLKAGKYPLTASWSIDSTYIVWHEDESMRAQFVGEHVIRLSRTDKTNTLYLPLLKIGEWRRTNPDTIGEYYLRND